MSEQTKKLMEEAKKTKELADKLKGSKAKTAAPPASAPPTPEKPKDNDAAAKEAPKETPKETHEDKKMPDDYDRSKDHLRSQAFINAGR